MNPEQDWGTLYAQGAMARLFQQQVIQPRINNRTYWIVGGIIVAIAAAAVGIGLYVRSRRRKAHGERRHKGSSDAGETLVKRTSNRRRSAPKRRSNRSLEDARSDILDNLREADWRDLRKEWMSEIAEQAGVDEDELDAIYRERDNDALDALKPKLRAWVEDARKPDLELVWEATRRATGSDEDGESPLTDNARRRRPKRRSNRATKSRKPMDVQTLIFPKDGYTLSEAKEWATEHGHKAVKVDEKEDTYRLRQHEPGLYQPKSFRTITLGKSAVKAVVGKRKAA